MYHKHSLNAIRAIVEQLPGMSALEQYQSFAAVKVLGAELDEYARSYALPGGTITIILTDPYEAVRALAGLKDKGGREDLYYQAEAYAAIDKLLRPPYFGGKEEG